MPRHALMALLAALPLLGAPGRLVAREPGGPGPGVGPGPVDRKEGAPRPKRGDPPPAALRPADIGIVRTGPSARPAAGPRPLSLEHDPMDLPPLAFTRERYVYLISPRARTGAFVGVHAFLAPPVAYRQTDPELVYERRDIHILARVGGSLVFRGFELGIDVPFVGLSQAGYFQQDEQVRLVRKVDRANLAMHAKYTLSMERHGHRLLLAPFFAVGAPTGMRERYTVRLAGQPVVKESSGPRTASLMPGLAAGWRRGIWAAVASVGVEAWLTLRDDYYDPAEVPLALRPKQPGVAIHAAYQLSATFVRDLALSVALQQVHEVVARTDGGNNDLLYLVPGIRLQPYHGFFGHVGVSFRLSRVRRESQFAMITLQAGWEFR